MLTVGLVGAGGMGRVHARQYAKRDDLRVRVFDQLTAKAEQLAAEHGFEVASSLEDLVTRADAIDVCLPTDLHLETALLGIAAGRAVLCEKPLASSLSDAELMANAAEQADVTLMPAHVLRFFPEFARARQLVEQGGIGVPSAASTHRGGRAPAGEGNWFRDLSRSGGVLLDLAIHDFDWLRWTLGEITEVNARATLGTLGVGDYGLTTLSFARGAVARVEATWLDPAGFRTAFDIAGSAGLLQHDSRGTPSFRFSTNESAATSPLSANDDPYFRQISAFLDSVSQGVPPPITSHDGVEAVRISEAAIQSARERRPIRLQA